MAINCQKCLYSMSITEALATLPAEACKALKDVIIPALVSNYCKRGIQNTVEDITEKLLLGLLNPFEIKCHICMKFNGWSRNLIKPLTTNYKENITETY